ncbi:putative inositol-1,4,5-trisphosphate 5-phosphatase 3 [Podospora australis]|uniref:Inositol-1,4,5-trisphosphate 5-phosphatase 3 n=1 Tax=Podospora australis TaxID=1536484 RepID=A0AAN6WPR2_9PEZI|nr:putative inositol-1,4,5-trisphosphate 5-phosphatase 3 [Podospora australis]
METSDAPPDSATSESVDLASTNPHSLHKAVHARRSEYIRRRRIRVKVGSWNVAAQPGTDKDLARWFVDGEGLDMTLGGSIPTDKPDDDNQKIDLYVLGLQEINLLTAPSQYMTWIYSPDTSTEEKWKAALEAGLPQGYQLVTSEHLAGMLLLVYASPEIAPIISNVSNTSVATGALGYLGNKGAVLTRMVVGEATKLLFVNCHLASGIESSYVERRIWQVQQILSYTRFEPITVSGVSEDDKGKVGDEDFAFWFGDLNSRLDRLPGEDIRRLLMLHTRGEYDLSKRELRREDSLEGEGVVVQRLSDSSDEVKDRDPTTSDNTIDRFIGQQADEPAKQGADDDSFELPDPDEFPLDPTEDPASLQTTLGSLLPHDQLRRLMKERKVFHEGWREGPITFLPSYKYDVGTVALFDSSEKRRPPSWCDRILYRSRKDREAYEKKVREEEESRKRDEEMKAQGMEEASQDDNVLFSYDPDNDGDDQPNSTLPAYNEYDENDDDGDEQSEEASTGKITLDVYTSHQRITSSDHKPISSIFTIDCDAVVPELKAKVHAEVARELDRAENEGRPVVTIVVDHQGSRPRSLSDLERAGQVVEFGDVEFLRRATATLTLANTGGVAATFSFIEKPNTDGSDGKDLPHWLSTSFTYPDAEDNETEASDLGKEVTLEPGETINAHLDAIVDDVGLARMLNEGQESLEDVLILCVRGGRDHFIPVHGSWAPTCIGRSVDELVRVPKGGIRKFAKSLAQKKGKAGAIPYELEPRHAAPRELFKLTEALETLTDRVLADAQMLDDCKIPTDPGWPFDETTSVSVDRDTATSQMITIIDTLDHDEDILPSFSPEISSLRRLEVVSKVLLLFLRGLTDGVITTPLWNRIEQASIPAIIHGGIASESTNEDDKTNILDILATAPNHNICFVFLTTALAKIAAELAPLTKADLEAIKGLNEAPARGLGALARKSLTFRRGTNAAMEAVAALNKRRAKEQRYAEIFGSVVCRGPSLEKDKDRKALQEKQKTLLDLFIRRRGD